MAEHLYADTVVIGGGTAGAAVAARLVQGTSQTVLLIESGPDYGAFAEQYWPAQLLDARSLPGGHDWNYVNGASTGRRGIFWSGRASLAVAPRTMVARRFGAVGLTTMVGRHWAMRVGVPMICCHFSNSPMKC